MTEFRNKGKAELLSPAGNPEKLKAAILYGADAVYLSGKAFGMRAASGNFTTDELRWAVEYCHSHGVRMYITLNIMPRTDEYPALREYVTFLRDLGADAVIVGDLGVFFLVREIAPNLDIHISTQASAVSAASCNAWYKLGAKRVVLARELTFKEILDIKQNIPDDLELEAFVHGAMCISYSGRCLLSNYLTGRDANHGTCAQSCRWIYSPVADPAREINLSESNRPDVHTALAAVEDGGDTFFMSSRDTSMIEYIPELEKSGIASYKIEGRVKSAYYTAVVTNTYRMALDRYRHSPENYVTDAALINELDSVSHREYGTGFYFTPPHENANTVTTHGYIREKAFLATAVENSVLSEDGLYDTTFIQRNKLSLGEAVEIISPGKVGRGFTADTLRNEKGEAIPSAPHPGMLFKLKSPFPVLEGDIIRGGK